MRILWFSNTPSLAGKILKTDSHVGGWIKSLESEITKYSNVELAVAFYHTESITPFISNKTKYYPIFRPYLLIPELIKRYTGESINVEREANDCIDIINDYKPDLIHIHGTEYPFGLFLLDSKVNIPTVISIQGILTVISKKFFSGIDKSSIGRITPFRDILLRTSFIDEYKAMLEKGIIERLVLKECKYIIGRTSWDKRIASVLAPSARYYHVDEILRDDFYRQVWKPNSHKEKVILTIMSSGLYKGVETIIETALLLKGGSDINFKWRIVGIRKTDSLVKLIKKYLRIKSNIPEIEFIGSLDGKNLLSEFLSADIYVSTSHIENSPNNVCEAMILGLPIIATNVGGVSSLLTDNKQGILVQDGDPWSLAGAIKFFIENYGTAMEYGKNARMKAVNRHDKKIISNSMLSIYTDIIK